MFGAFSPTGAGSAVEPGHRVFPLGSGVARDIAVVEHTCVLLEGHPHWNQPNDGPATAQSVAEAFLRGGISLLGSLNGGFGLAIMDNRERRLHLAIDRIGIAQLGWMKCGDRIVFGSSLRQIASGCG